MLTPDASTFTAFDWFLTAIVALSTIAAFFRGIIKVLFSLAGLIFGIILAAWNYVALATRLHGLIGSIAAAQVVAFLLIAIATMVIFSLLAAMLRKAVSAVGLGFFDRIFGAAVGFLRGVLIGVAVMMAISAFLPGAPLVKNSRLAPYFLRGAHAVSFVVPQRMQQQISAGAAHLLQQSPELFKYHRLPQRSGD